MKKILTSSILIFTFFNISFAQTSSDEDLLKALVQKSFDDIFSNMDVESIPEYFTEDFILLEHGEVWDLTNLKSMLNSDNRNGIKRINDFEFIQIKVNGDTAWLAYHNKASFKKGDEIVGEMKWLESATAIRTKDGWRMDMLHSTRKPQNE
ncbi:DUF4440 domain-containing protein [Christiangramia sediminis]|uniref:Nuclear transport factor 2 family protein n=1 Tax=Christiangramia sediminis TaxID=2881336 RepID=A0A9X1LJ57_9FLAO|nr:DUF4440 domain-containing protein [Christiangramia sediminis]MCB7481275.1 nuclear transport factor 2 family protein [Christiangramia sediminis]